MRDRSVSRSPTWVMPTVGSSSASRNSFSSRAKPSSMDQWPFRLLYQGLFELVRGRGHEGHAEFTSLAAAGGAPAVRVSGAVAAAPDTPLRPPSLPHLGER